MAKTVKQATDFLIKHYKNGKVGWKAKGVGYECVGLMQEYLRQIGDFDDPVLPNAYNYANAFKENSKKDILGYSKGTWKIVKSGFKKGDIVFYEPTPANGNGGHVAIAIDNKNVLQQNVVSPFDGSYKYLTKSAINTYGIPIWAARKVEKSDRIGWAYFMGKSGRKVKVEIMPWDLYEDKTNNLDQFAHGIWIQTASKRYIYDAETNEIVGHFSPNSEKRYMYINSQLEKKMKRGKRT